ncbi:non-ribosomal peptide synthetase [Micromonospora tarensis]|uniref:Non-ribosomal peptide synthetase n=1 Tax=Micromonospora tarensis TaxID=2806100 RepID=A0ABS1YDB9_9ACTN|nr:non-ribosomal peptide synthetase [Micromonospora tarensis]MBM0275404.1 non-ribosomal peptide synthetase [Micromonospora tarensis]
MTTRDTGSPAAQTLTGMFATSVRTWPDRPAVSDDDTTLSYAELDRRSAALAVDLRARGIGAEDRVGLYLDRSVDLVVAVLGILRAGAGYVAVDARYPDGRRDHMLVAGGCKLVVTRADWQQRIAHLGLDELPFRSTATPAAPAVDHAESAGAASVLFTSGSAGKPKAIVLEHRNIVSFAANPSLPELVPDDRVGQISSVSFDAFHFELWTTLYRGAELAVLPAVPELLAADFRREMRRRRITAMLVPTMVINQVIREDRDAFAPLRILQAGGDVLLPSACRDLLHGDFQGELYNLYGPAEATTACTAHRVTVEDAERDTIPIGRPLAGVTVLLLGDGTRAVPDGEIGEIHIGGPGVARGYLDAPELTRQQFVAGPRPDGPDRLYRTGDLARRRPDGVLEFVGRTDGQVKIRGYRVEPGEVERSLCRSHGVREAVVVPSGEGEDRHLLAVVVPAEDTTLREIQEFARAELPDYLVPSQFALVEEIPSNEHGKRDMAALHGIADRVRERRARHVAPRTEVERYLAELWEELLGVENVGVNEDFFTLGGHSLLAFRMHSQVKRRYGVSVELAAVLRDPLLSDVAALVERARAGGPGA